MRASEHFLEPPLTDVYLVDDEPLAVGVQIRQGQSGAQLMVSTNDYEHLITIANAFLEGARQLRQAQLRAEGRRAVA